MKQFTDFILSEAVATRKKPTRAEKTKFADKFDQVVYSKPFTDLQDKRYLHQWHVTGHNPGTKHGTNKAIEAVKEKVFGKRRKGTSDLLWIHRKHGLVTHPAIGDVTHMDVQHKPRKGIKVNKKINAKFTETQADDILGRGRIEHHEGGGGIISYTHGSQGSRAAAVRTIARKYPKYKIHDGFGNLLESETDEVSEAVATRKKPPQRKKPTRRQKIDFRNKFMDVSTSNEVNRLRYKSGGIGPWHLTGHNPSGRHGTSHAIEAVKEKVFGKRRKGTSDLLWMHHKHGLITHPAVGDITHVDVDNREKYKTRKGIKVDKTIQAKVKEGGIGALMGHGRVEHHEGGGGLISYHHVGGMPKEAAIRTIARKYPKYKIHDGFGNLLEGYGTTKDGWLHSRSLGRRRWMKGNHSIERQGKRGWTVYDWHANKELHVAKTAKEAKAWSEKNRPSTSTPATINIKLFENWSYAHDFDIRKKIREEWSEKYKRSIDCNNPKGFSQRAHCQGRKKLNEVSGVLSFKSFITEQTEERIKDFVDFASDYLGLKQDPDIEFVDQREDGMTTACYSPSECKIKIYKGNRATFDICRSIAHEMVHQMQDENGDELDGTTGSPCEDEANALAGRMIRIYGSNKEGFYEE